MAKVFYDASMVVATTKKSISSQDIARVLGLPENEVEVFTSECVKQQLVEQMDSGARWEYREKYRAALQAAKGLGGMTKCYGHVKGTASADDCLATFLRHEPDWVVGSCDPDALKGLRKDFPRVQLLTVGKDGLCLG